MKKLLFLLFLPLLITCSQEPTSSEHYVRQRVVQLIGNNFACSAVQIEAPSGLNYILTAAHCDVLIDENNQILASLDNQRAIPRRVLEISNKTDLMLLEGMPNLKGIEVGNTPNSNDSLYSLTHGDHKPTYRMNGEYLKNERDQVLLFEISNEEDIQKCISQPKTKVGEVHIFFFSIPVCMLDIDFMISTLNSIPGSSGGAILNQDGELVSIVSASSIFFTLSIPTNEIKEFLSAY